MPTYEIEQYELHTMKYRVEAEDEAHAIAKLLNGEADPMDNSLEYIEVADDYGLPVDENRDLVDQLRERGITVGDDIIPSVRNIEQVE
jgi:type III secretion system FlhB-like substrate exporter